MNWSQKAYACLLLALCLSGLAQAQVYLSGPVSGVLVDTTYIVTSTIKVPSGDSLVILPGATFLFLYPSFFHIHGHLYAVGTEQDSIRFLPEPTSDWMGIQFYHGSAGSQIGYAIISKPLDGVGVFADGIVFSHCSVLEGEASGIRGLSLNYLTITDCDIVGNESEYPYDEVAAGLHFQACHHVVVSNCRIMNNVCWDYFYQDGAGAIRASSYSDLTLTNCLIRGNQSFVRAAVLTVDYSSRGEISNCTIVENEGVGGSWVYGIRIGSATRITNCIIRNDRIREEFEQSTGSVLHCNVQGGYQGTGNFDANPRFVDGPEGPYYLSQIAAGQTVNSPCLDAGHPRSPMIIGTTRTDGVQDSGRVDIGYHYPVADDRALAGNWEQGKGDPTGAAGEQAQQEYSVVIGPNPFNPITAISYQLSADRHVKLEVFDTAGRLVATLVNGWRGAGSHQVTWDASGLPSGLYFCRMQAGDWQGTGKMVLMK
jgi:hypothetical protein